MRGKEVFSDAKVTPYGITPAYAGKRSAGLVTRGVAEDHPRLCGEKQMLNFQLLTVLGSPPPMRGKEDGMKIRVDLDRITPAYAGKRHDHEV